MIYIYIYENERYNRTYIKSIYIDLCCLPNGSPIFFISNSVTLGRSSYDRERINQGMLLLLLTISPVLDKEVK